jgi:hypothetical protein
MIGADESMGKGGVSRPVRRGRYALRHTEANTSEAQNFRGYTGARVQRVYSLVL